MKKPFLFALIYLIAFFSESAAQKRIEIIYPEDSISASSKKAFIKEFNKGRILYNITCAKCHNIKEVIPDFSMPQLMDYEMRLYSEHTEKLNDEKITDGEMAQVILFLRYKTKTGKNLQGQTKRP